MFMIQYYEFLQIDQLVQEIRYSKVDQLEQFGYYITMRSQITHS